jgi:hypothetical protein
MTDNNGLQSIANQALIWSKLFGVGVADIIQFGAAHAVVTCPLGPRTRVFVGRKDSKQAAPQGLMPSVTMSADDIISLFEDKTIQPHDLAALLGAHSTSQQFVTDKTKAGFGQDSTPGVRRIEGKNVRYHANLSCSRYGMSPFTMKRSSQEQTARCSSSRVILLPRTTRESAMSGMLSLETKAIGMG